MINSAKLSKELIAAGISTDGNCNSSGIVWDDNNNEIQDRKDVAAIIAEHDPTPVSEPSVDKLGLLLKDKGVITDEEYDELVKPTISAVSP
jgi:hypothetical protein